MSFILDALKKSDRKRQESLVPRLDTFHEPIPPKAQRRPLWLSLLLLVLFLNIGLLLWFFAPWRQTPIAGPATVAQHEPVVNAQVAPDAVPARPYPSAQEQPQVQPAKRSNQAVVPPASIPVVTTQIVTTPVVFQPEAGIDDRIYLISELPNSVRRNLPEMHISLHAFNQADGAASLVRINDQILREGGWLAGKYLLTQITAEGAVFASDGYRFLVPRKRQVEN